MNGYATRTRDRVGAAAISAAVLIGLMTALISGFAITYRQSDTSALSLFTPPAPESPAAPRPVEKRPRPSHRPEGRAAPPNIRSRSTAIVAPRVEVSIPPPVVVAPDPGVGRQATQGAADVPGPGTGAGGVGDGTGSGRQGDGGGGGGAETPPRRAGGRIGDRDFPDALRGTSDGGVVGVRYTVLASGRVGNCRITRSSGVPLLDQTTCRLITRRFRFHPSRDAAGRPVDADIVENHEWVNEMTAADLIEPPPPTRRRRPWW